MLGTSSTTLFDTKYASLGGSAWCISCLTSALSSAEGSPAAASPAAASIVGLALAFISSGSHAYRWSRSASVRCLGESFLSVVYAGQLSLQRPHSVQV